MSSDNGPKKVGIIAGGGTLPLSVAQSVRDRGAEPHIVGIDGEADLAISDFSHSWIKWGEIGKMLQILQQENAGDVVIIGSVSRPDLSKIRMDFGAIKNLPFILSLMVGGDDTVLSGIVKFFEKHGFHVKGAHQVAPSLLCPVGPLGKKKPAAQDEADIELALKVVETLGPLDVGQGAVAARGHVIAVEAAEGTDAMLERCTGLKQWGGSKWGGRTGVLVKRPKPGQEMRIDMPAVGPRTVELADKAGLAGIALHAGNVLLADKERLVKEANAKGLFIVGLDMSSGQDTPK